MYPFPSKETFPDNGVYLRKRRMTACVDWRVLSSCTEGAGTAEKHFTQILRKRRMTVVCVDWRVLSSCTEGAGTAEKLFTQILRKRRMTVLC